VNSGGSPKTTLLGTLSRLGLLAALGYLGFYVYGLVMGVFSPFELVGFTLVAIGCLAAFIGYSLRLRRAMRTPGEHEALMRQAHFYRERRGVLG
jgi:hypothetical protein